MKKEKETVTEGSYLALPRNQFLEEAFIVTEEDGVFYIKDKSGKREEIDPNKYYIYVWRDGEPTLLKGLTRANSKPKQPGEQE